MSEIVLGLGNNIDYEITWDSNIIERMIREQGISNGEISIPREIATFRDMILSILGFLRQGTGGERFVSDPTIIEDFADNFEKKITLGGTSVRAAMAMRKLGVLPAVHLVTMNEPVSHLLPEDCPRLCSNREIRSYPHLIVQFHRGIRIDVQDIHIETDRSNRIIYTHDRDNALMVLHERLSDFLSDAKVFLISGFNAMRDSALLEERLRQLQESMETLPPGAVVFYEDACFHDPSLSAIVRRYLAPKITIYSLNEDELQNYLSRTVLLTDAQAVAEALEDLQNLLPVPVLILHTRYWALAYGTEACCYTNALLGGVTMATTRFRCGDTFTRQDYEETLRLPPETAGETFASEIQDLLGNKVSCIPSFLVPETQVTTVGLGDTFVGGFLPVLV